MASSVALPLPWTLRGMVTMAGCKKRARKGNRDASRVWTAIERQRTRDSSRHRGERPSGCTRKDERRDERL